MRKQFPVYRILLHLYPRSYRQEYGDQMVQTLQDMLDDRTSSSARAMLWLRVALETPVSIMQENISIGGEKAMDKLTMVSNKKLAIGAGVIILLLIAAGLTFGRDALFSNTMSFLYGHSMQTTEAAADAGLGKPFALLTSTDPRVNTGCSVVARSFISTEVECNSQMRSYTKLGQSATDEATVMKSVTQLEDSLKTLGYKTDLSRGITVTSLVSGTYKGVDWTPDAFYERVAGAYDCIFDMQIAYSNLAHQQPAISLSLTCNRTFDIFGKPSNEIYSSRKGVI